MASFGASFVTTGQILDNAITSLKIADDEIVNADVNSSAAIAYSKLAALTAANILVGNASNVPTSVTMSGDATISNTGALTIANNAVSLAKMATGTAGNLITYSGAGAPAAVATGTTGQVLTSNGAGVAPTFQAAASAAAVVSLNTVQRTAGNITTTSTSFVDATGMSVTQVTGANTVVLIASGCVSNSGIGNSTRFDFDIDGTRVGQDLGMYQITTPVQGYDDIFNVVWVTTVTAASHTFKLQWDVSTGTGTIRAVNTEFPLRMTVIELTD